MAHVSLIDRVNASYRLRACRDAVCIDSVAVSPVSLNPAIFSHPETVGMAFGMGLMII